MLQRKTTRPVTQADLLRRQAALGLVAVSVEEPPAAEAQAAPEPAPATVIEPPGWPFVAAPTPTVEPAMPEREDVGPGPGLPLGSVLGCAHGERHHLAWTWWSVVGRYVCRRCEYPLWRRIPKADLDDLRP